MPLCRRLRDDPDGELTPWKNLIRAPSDGLRAEWLEEVQAALDCTYRALSKEWLTVTALLDDKGTLRDVGAATQAFG